MLFCLSDYQLAGTVCWIAGGLVKLLSVFAVLLVASAALLGCTSPGSKLTAASEATSSREPASYQCAPLSFQESGELDYAPTGRLIQAQPTCSSANKVFNKCPHGAMSPLALAS